MHVGWIDGALGWLQVLVLCIFVLLFLFFLHSNRTRLRAQVIVHVRVKVPLTTTRYKWHHFPFILFFFTTVNRREVLQVIQRGENIKWAEFFLLEWGSFKPFGYHKSLYRAIPAALRLGTEHLSKHQLNLFEQQADVLTPENLGDKDAAWLQQPH